MVSKNQSILILPDSINFVQHIKLISHNANEPFKKELKNYDASNLPPCTAELHQQILRTHVLQAFSKMHIYGSQVVYQWMRLTRWEI
jgi:hypothetical protein